MLELRPERAPESRLQGARPTEGHGSTTSGSVCDLSHQVEDSAKNSHTICASAHDDEYKEVALMMDSGANEIVASADRFGGYPLGTSTATGAVYFSASAGPSEEGLQHQ